MSTKLEVGFYSTTDAFRAIDQHVAVMRADCSLVAVTGPSTGKGAMEAIKFAQLFAAAPQLLEACEDAVEELKADENYVGENGGEADFLVALRAAIAKARGER